MHPMVAAVCAIPFHLNSTHLTSSQLVSPHFISSHRMSSLPCSALLSWSQLFSSLLMSPELFSSRLSLSQRFLTLDSSSQLFSAPCGACQLILCLLISSLLFSHLQSSSHISSADLSSCQLVSPHLSSSQRTLKSSQLFSGPKPVPNEDLGAKASDAYAFHREDLTQRTFTHSKLLPREACTHRSFYTETGKLLHRDREAFTRNKLLHRASFLHTASFYTQQAFTRAMASEIAARKLDLGAKAKKEKILKHFLKGILKGKSPAPKFRKSTDKSPSQP